MKGPWNFERDTRQNVEAKLIQEENNLSILELADKSMNQALRCLNAAHLVANIEEHSTRLTTIRDENRLELLARTVVQSIGDYFPDHIIDPTEQAALVIAIARTIENNKKISN